VDQPWTALSVGFPRVSDLRPLGLVFLRGGGLRLATRLAMIVTKGAVPPDPPGPPLREHASDLLAVPHPNVLEPVCRRAAVPGREAGGADPREPVCVHPDGGRAHDGLTSMVGVLIVLFAVGRISRPDSLIWNDLSSCSLRACVTVRVPDAGGAAVEAAPATVDHSDIRGSSLGLAVMVVIRRELPRTSVAGPANGRPHRSQRGLSFPWPPRPLPARRHDSLPGLVPTSGPTPPATRSAGTRPPPRSPR
jgi:hypothetical protein